MFPWRRSAARVQGVQREGHREGALTVAGVHLGAQQLRSGAGVHTDAWSRAASTHSLPRKPGSQQAPHSTEKEPFMVLAPTKWPSIQNRSWFLHRPPSPAGSPGSCPGPAHLLLAHGPQSSLRPHHPDGPLCPGPHVPRKGHTQGCVLSPPPMRPPQFRPLGPQTLPAPLHPSQSGILAASLAPPERPPLPRLHVGGRREQVRPQAVAAEGTGFTSPSVIMDRPGPEYLG